MLTVVKISEDYAHNISNAERFELHGNILKIIDFNGNKTTYTLPLSEEHAKRFFDIFLGNLSVSNYINIEKILEYNFKDVILEECQQEEQLERERQFERRRAEEEAGC